MRSSASSDIIRFATVGRQRPPRTAPLRPISLVLALGGNTSETPTTRFVMM